MGFGMLVYKKPMIIFYLNAKKSLNLLCHLFGICMCGGFDLKPPNQNVCCSKCAEENVPCERTVPQCDFRDQ